MMRIKMGWIAWTTVVAATVLSVGSLAPAAANAQPVDGATAATLCATSYPGVTGPDQLSPCQWDMKVIEALAAHTRATGARREGRGDRRRDRFHPSGPCRRDQCGSLVLVHQQRTPTADPAEIANGNCANKAAVQDLQGHGTHVATIIAGRREWHRHRGRCPESDDHWAEGLHDRGFLLCRLGGGSAPLCGRQAPRHRQPQSLCRPISIFLRQ